MSQSEDPEKFKKQKYYESNAGDGTKATDQHLSGITLTLTLTSCVVSLFLVALDQTIISTILKEVGNKFGEFEKIGWLTTGFMLPLATLAPSYGKISIAFGRKYTLLVCIIIFEIGSLVSALATSMDMLIGGRVIQGIGGGGTQSMVTVIMTESVPISKRALAFILIGVTFSVSSVLGPFIGGALASNATWRWCFYINLPIGGVAWVLLFLCFHPPNPKGNIKQKLQKIDYIGTFLISGGLILLLLGLSFGGVQFPWKSAAVICCFVLGGLLTIAFTYYNFFVSKNPIIYKEIIKIPPVIGSFVSATFNFGFFLSNLVYLAIYFQIVFNATAYESGVDLIPLVLSVSVSSITSGLLLRWTRNVKLIIVFSSVLGPIGCGLLILLDVDSNSAQRIGLLIVSGVSSGLQFSSSIISAQLKAPPNIEGSLIITSTTLNFCRSAGAAFSVIVADLIYQTCASNYIESALHKISPSSSIYKEIRSISISAIISSPDIMSSFSDDTRTFLLDELMKAFRAVFYFGLAQSIVGLIGSLFSTNKMIPKDDEVRKKNDGSDDPSESNENEESESTESNSVPSAEQSNEQSNEQSKEQSTQNTTDDARNDKSIIESR